MLFKIKKKLWENVPKEAAFNCVAAKLYKFLFLSCVSYMLLNLVHKLKCETNLTAFST